MSLQPQPCTGWARCFQVTAAKGKGQVAAGSKPPSLTLRTFHLSSL